MAVLNWQVKSAIQRTCGALPWISEPVYYQIQRRFGSFRRPPAPTVLFREAVSLSEWMDQAGISIKEARVFEVGTGRRVDLPLGFYLCGSAAVWTFDLHRYLKPELVAEALAFVRDHRHDVGTVFAGRNGSAARLDRICKAGNVEELLNTAGIVYHAPADAARTGLPSHSIDVHTSYTAFEHISPDALAAILQEARRLLSPRGVLLHHIDPSDHFSHDDPSISAIHFLRFSESEWRRYGDNQFAYHNRLRVTQFRQLFEECGFEVVRWETHLDARALNALNNGFPVHADFRGFSPEILCSTVVRVLARARN
ncbi:MAG: methyltransferase domain-containing protein [Gammaproteobacteria bacterium]